MAEKKKSRADMYYVESRDQWRKRIKIGGRTRDIYAPTQREVRDKIRELQKMEDAGMAIDDNTTLLKLALEWYAVKKKSIRPKSAEVYQNTLNNHILPFFKDMLLRDVKPLHIKKLLAQNADKSKSLQSKILFTLSQIMRTGIENGLIIRNPCDNVKAGGTAARRKVPLTSEQQKALTDAAYGTRVEPFVLLCLYAGLRREEALGLLWSDLYLDDLTAWLEVNHTVTFNSNQPVFSPLLKSQAAHRKIPLPDGVAIRLKELRQSAKGVLVVSNATGQAMSKVALRRAWGPAVEHLGFGVTPHQLRHTYLTELCASGLDIKKIQYLAGHEDPTMTLRIYTQVVGNTPVELAPSINTAFSYGGQIGGLPKNSDTAKG